MKTFGLIASRSLVLIIAALSIACTSTGTSKAPSIQTAPEAEVSFDGLHKVDNAQADLARIR